MIRSSTVAMLLSYHTGPRPLSDALRRFIIIIIMVIILIIIITFIIIVVSIVIIMAIITIFKTI